MKKVALIVEPQFIERHVGVRNYMFSLRLLLERTAKVDFVTFYKPDAGRVQWYRTSLRNRQFMVDNGVATDHTFAGRPADVLKQYRHCPGDATVDLDKKVYYTHFGRDLAREGYDACVITNPWLLNLGERIPIPEQYGVAHDAIPNRYVLTNPAVKPFVFAEEHANGYEYFRRHCRATFAISETTRGDLIRFFGLPPAGTVVLPPLLPVSYFDPTIPIVPRENAIALASPFDRRKGLDAMPDLINPLVDAGVLSKLYMYGGVRCSGEDLERFFARLDPRTEIVWHNRATATTVKRVFATARLCLFPSTSEGLGLPPLEAQFCGCRVLARDIEPMNKNLLTGSILMAGDPASVAEQVRDAVTDERFDHDALRAEAVRRFSPDLTGRVIEGAMAETKLRHDAHPVRRTGLRVVA